MNNESNSSADGYARQDRGTDDQYLKYLAGMDTVSVEKVAAASAYFSNRAGGTIVDVGMASGTSTHILACLFPASKVIGVDINPRMVDLARAKNDLPNLEFRIDDGETLETLSDEKITGFFNCSSIHHITSFNHYDPHRAFLTLERQSDLLSSDGVIVVRDFVKPEDKEIILKLPDNKDAEASDAELILTFSRTARSLSDPSERGFPIRELQPQSNNRRFRLMYADALEFIRRKDYRNDWEVELQEEYAYFKQTDFEALFARLGLRIIASYPIYNPWILKNRYEGKFRLLDLENRDLGLPPTNYIIAGEKCEGKGVRLKTVRHLPIQKRSFLSIGPYKDKDSGNVFDVARRPSPVIDLIPYTLEKNTLKVLAQHGYPRPIINVETDSSLLDDKKYSGYIIEGITVMKGPDQKDETIRTAIRERAGLKSCEIDKIEASLSYYTSPGGVDEVVQSAFIKLKGGLKRPRFNLDNYSGFTDSGSIREYDAVQLIKSAQVGALPEARLEMNVYHLMARLGFDAGRWLGEKIDVAKAGIADIKNIDGLLPKGTDPRYEPSDISAGFIEHRRSKFFEYGQSESAAIREYIIPRKFSINTVICLPVFMFEKEYYVGIEHRHLPVPQLQEGDSLLLAAPAYRLPKDIRNYSELKKYLLGLDFFNSKILSVSKLGEKYFPCTGITPEQVYPYVVGADKPSTELHWVSLRSLFLNTEKLRDGHLLISIFRLVHALNQWKNYCHQMVIPRTLPDALTV